MSTLNRRAIKRLLGIPEGTVASEQAVLDGAIAGTAVASKAVVLGASKDIATITSATITTLTSTTVNATTLTAGTVTATAINVPSIVRQSATFSATSGDTGTTLTNLTGMVQTVVPGTYAFTINLGTVATANSGLKVGFKLTTTVLTSIEYQAVGATASAVVGSRGTTATDQMSLFANTSAHLVCRITGTMVVGTGGTIQVQAAQNASHADTTSVFLGSSFELVRIA